MTYRVHGMMQSYFTRKMTGYLDYKRIPWLLPPLSRREPRVPRGGLSRRRTGGARRRTASSCGTRRAMIHHLELRFPEPAVLPDDPVQRFLCYVIEDAADEWLYRPAVGTRWHFPENAAVGGFELARDISVQMPLACDQAHAGVGAHVRSSCPPLGVTPENIQHWVDDVLRPWMRAARRAPRGAPVPLRRPPVARRLRALRRQRGALRQRSALPALDRRGCARGRAAHASAARARGSDVRRLGRRRRRAADAAGAARRARTRLSAVGQPGVRRRQRRRRARAGSPRDRRRDRLPPRRARDAARPLRRALRSPALDAVLDRAGILAFFADAVEPGRRRSPTTASRRARR